MSKYKKGTQEMLDAAKDDATLLPFDTVFVTANKNNSFKTSRVNVIREKNESYDQDDKCSVRFAPIGCYKGVVSFSYIEREDLLPSKKSKPKKWQNGTQAQLDAAKYVFFGINRASYFASSSCA